MAAIKNPAFDGVDFSKYTPASFIMHVCLKGSPIQRAALARCMKPEAGYYFPGISAMAQTPQGLKTCIDLISQLLESLAEHLGVKFVGPSHAVAYTIIQDFGGLSVADFLLFIERCKSGDFRKDFQHVASRGVNYEFLRAWLDAFCEEREACRAAIYEQTKIGKRIQEDGPPCQIHNFIVKMQEDLQQKKANRIRLQSEADAIFRAWHQTMFYTDIVDGYPIERERPGAILRRLWWFLREFVFYEEGGSKKAAQAVDALYERARNKYAGDLDGNLDDAVFAELRAVLAELERFKSSVTACQLCTRAFEFLNPGQPGYILQRAAAQYLREFNAFYFKKYLPACVEHKYPRLSARDFVWSCAYVFFVKASGKHPLRQILSENF